MKTKKLLLILAVTLVFTGSVIAQNLPSYVPPSGLVGWFPFNGNANDESGTGNNGTVNGATLTTDRFGNMNKAFNLNGLSDYISIPDNNSLDFTNAYSISVWVQIPDYTTPQEQNGSGATDPIRTIIGKPRGSDWATGYSISSIDGSESNKFSHRNHNGINQLFVHSNSPLPLNTWVNIVAVKTNSSLLLYKNGILEQSSNLSFTLINSSEPLYIGKEFSNLGENWYRYFKGKVDDIGLWNRALTPQEILDLFIAVNCANNLAITPQNNSINKSGIAQFTATTSDSNPNFIWQSDFGQGFQTLNNFGNYSGANSSNLNIANVQLSEHKQAFRVISTSGNCVDTSNVAIISILDTCITTIYDTVIISVTDTLIINAKLTGLNAPNNINKLKVFPNPANTHITIDYGNHSLMNGYSVEITNSIGQKVFNANIGQQTSFIDISSWTGNGVYFIKIIDSQSNTIEIRKILIQ